MTFVRNYAYTLGRILLSMIFLMAGLIKLDDPAAFAALLETAGIPGIASYPLIAVEIVGGTMLLVGYQTRNAAIVLACLFFGRMILMNMTLGNQMEIMTFIQNIGLAGGFLILFSRGAGVLSVDHRS